MARPIAIQTRYKGHHFRSRLEARWAVFFDAAGVKWEYEKEGYDLSELAAEDGKQDRINRYLPDFWLPEYKVWVEIKGQLPDVHWTVTDEESRLFYLVCLTKAVAGWIFFGMPDLDTPNACVFWGDNECYPESPDRNAGGIVDMLYNHNLSAEIVAAATSARFEFGQSGARLREARARK